MSGGGFFVAASMRPPCKYVFKGSISTSRGLTYRLSVGGGFAKSKPIHRTGSEIAMYIVMQQVGLVCG